MRWSRWDLSLHYFVAGGFVAGQVAMGRIAHRDAERCRCPPEPARSAAPFQKIAHAAVGWPWLESGGKVSTYSMGVLSRKGRSATKKCSGSTHICGFGDRPGIADSAQQHRNMHVKPWVLATFTRCSGTPTGASLAREFDCIVVNLARGLP